MCLYSLVKLSTDKLSQLSDHILFYYVEVIDANEHRRGIEDGMRHFLRRKGGCIIQLRAERRQRESIK